MFYAASVGCTNDEIAARLGVSPDTLTRRFSDVLVKARAEMRCSLRAKQYEEAMNGNTKLLTWLGVNLLGQRPQPQDQVLDAAATAAAIRAALRQMDDTTAPTAGGE